MSHRQHILTKIGDDIIACDIINYHVLHTFQIACCKNEINIPLSNTSQAAMIVNAEKSCTWLQDCPQH